MTNISLYFFNQVPVVKRLLALLFACLLFPLLISGCAAASSLSGKTPSPAATAQPTAEALIAETPTGETLSEAGASGAQPAENQGQPADQTSSDRSCKDSLTFTKDLTIPDGTLIAPESTLDKRWQVENSGDCNWGPAYRVRLIAGPELGAQKEQALYPARGGTQAVIRILFKAPTEAGTYRSAWQAINAQGEPFGDPFFIDIKVEAPQ